MLVNYVLTQKARKEHGEHGIQDDGYLELEEAKGWKREEGNHLVRSRTLSWYLLLLLMTSSLQNNQNKHTDKN